ncbi:MAG: hypothetical protein ACI82N_000763 [Maricaulis sp.]|jgi:hypothetical protein
MGAARLMSDGLTLRRLGFWCDAAFGAGLLFVLF